MLRESRLTTGICSSKIEIMGFYQKTRKEANHPMKHQLLALLLGSLLLLGLPAACADTPTMTVLMYMCGTDLQSDCVNDLYEMCAADIPDNVKNSMEIVPVSRMGEVIEHALLRKPEPIEWDGAAEAAKVPPVESTEDGTGAIAH